MAFLSELDPKDARSIPKAQAAVADPNIKNELAFIKCNFSCISAAITKLETTGVLLGDAIRTFKSIQTKLQAIPRLKELLQKFNYVHIFVSPNNNTNLAPAEKFAG